MGGYAQPTVGHLQPQQVLVAGQGLNAHRQADVAARRRKFAGVGEEVADNFVQLVPVQQAVETVRLGAKFQRYALVFGDGPEAFGQQPQLADELRGLGPQVQPSYFQLAEVQDLVDQRQQPPGILLYGLHTLAQTRVGRRRLVLLQALGRANDEGQRGAKLMGDVGVQLVFERIQRAQPAVFGLRKPLPELEAEDGQPEQQQQQDIGHLRPGLLPPYLPDDEGNAQGLLAHNAPLVHAAYLQLVAAGRQPLKGDVGVCLPGHPAVVQGQQTVRKAVAFGL